LPSMACGKCGTETHTCDSSTGSGRLGPPA
jgi:hypothetical protein